jgi:hypothetical protein
MKLNKKGMKQFPDSIIDDGEFVNKSATIQDNKTVWKNLKKCRGEAFVFKLSPPWQGHEYVLESTVPSEVMYFACDKYGKVKDFTDLPLDLETEGYEIL